MSDCRPAEFGAWYPRFNTFQMGTPWVRYVNDVQELFAQRLRNYKALVLWRAYGPTHFGGPTGTYTGARSFFHHSQCHFMAGKSSLVKLLKCPPPSSGGKWR